jgi:SAM-dependent methyltransferase
VYVNPRPTRAGIGRFYPPEYGPHARPAVSAPSGRPEKRSLRKRLRNIGWVRLCFDRLVESRGHIIPVPAATSVPRGLEIGCAGGAFLETLRARGWRVTGVEPSAAAARQAQQKGFDIHVGTFESAALPDAQFDAVFAWMVVEHVHDPPGTLKRILQLLKPGGTFLFSVPNFGCWEAAVAGRYWWALDLPRHLQHFTPRTLRQMLRDAGFEGVEIIHQRNVFNLVGTVGLWLMARFPGKSWGRRLIRYIDNPGAGGILALAPLAWFFAAIRQGGRLTVIARKPASDSSIEPKK